MSLTMMVLAAAMMAAPGDAVVARETALWDNAKGHKMEAFQGELAPDFVAVYAHAVNDGKAEVAAIHQQQLSSFALKDFAVRDLAAGVQLVTYTADAKGTFQGADISGTYRATSIWKDGKLVYHSEMKAQ